MKAKPKPPCKHSKLHFEDGGLHIVCSTCKYTWVAVGHDSLRCVHDIQARAMGLSHMDERRDPYSSDSEGRPLPGFPSTPIRNR